VRAGLAATWLLLQARLCGPEARRLAATQVSGAITFLRTENMFYPACSNKIAEGRQCNKKLQDNGDGTWCAHPSNPPPAVPPHACPPPWRPLLHPSLPPTLSAGRASAVLATLSPSTDTCSASRWMGVGDAVGWWFWGG
jgi:hypothetical protein